MNKPSLPSGTRDFSPEEVYRRQYIFNTIRSVFEKYGYQPIETPVMENLSTLEGKYGEEGDKLLFRILNSGDFWKEIGSREAVINTTKNALPLLSEKGLRYDLTVPFARYVVMHRNDITLPFKRYQIQPVYRADRPQRGRYREFYQCDADVVGSDSLLNEVELIQIYDEVFSKLRIDIVIKLNNRKILEGLVQAIDGSGKFKEFTIAIDKLDKIGIGGVKDELISKGFGEGQLQAIEKFFSLHGDHTSILTSTREMLKDSDVGLEGITELELIFDRVESAGPIRNAVEIDFTLARGLDYYTGPIIEVKATQVKMGSIGGGGRYDDLTGTFGLKGIPGVGISFGADRIYTVMEELNLFPESTAKGTSVLFINFDEASEKFALPLLKKVRDADIAAEIYPSAEKLKKQMKYADDKKIPFVVFTGENEMKSTDRKLAIKNMTSGEQKSLTIEEIISMLKDK